MPLKMEKDLNSILDKINREGFKSLTTEEEERLYKSSKIISKKKKKRLIFCFKLFFILELISYIFKK